MKGKLVRTTFDIDNPPPLSDAERDELERLAAVPDEEIDFSDIPHSDFRNAVRLRDLLRRRKQPTTVRIDADVLHWLKSKGRGYQTRLNAILREAMKKDVA